LIEHEVVERAMLDELLTDVERAPSEQNVPGPVRRAAAAAIDAVN
jgi:hypothetical protein